VNERRQYHRYLLHTEINHESVNSRQSSTAVTKDISHGGICITTKGFPLAIGDTYAINFMLPGVSDPIKALAEAVWIKEEGRIFDNGLMFTRISAQAREMIDDFSIGSIEEK